MSHTDLKTGQTIRFKDLKTLGLPFNLSEYATPYNPSRIQAMTTGDALVDANLTIRHPRQKTPGLAPYFIGRRQPKTTAQLDEDGKHYQDYTGTRILKVDPTQNVKLEARHMGLMYSHYPGFPIKKWATEDKSDILTSIEEVEKRPQTGSLRSKIQLMRLMLKNEKQANELI